MITNYFLKCISEDIYKHQRDSKIPATYYVGLSSSAPTVDGSGVTEPIAPEYKRVKINNGNDFGEANSDGTVSNIKRFSFPEAQIPWGTITHYVIFDEQTEGNLLIYGKLAFSIDIPIKTIVSIPEEMLIMNVANM